MFAAHPSARHRHRSVRRSFASILSLGLVLAAALFAAEPASAHAILLASTPVGGSTVAAGEMEFILRFNSRIDRARSVVRLLGVDRRESVLALNSVPDSPDVLRGRLDLSPGRYVLRWQVLAVDGHITRGDVPFAVAPRN